MLMTYRQVKKLIIKENMQNDLETIGSHIFFFAFFLNFLEYVSNIC